MSAGGASVDLDALEARWGRANEGVVAFDGELAIQWGNDALARLLDEELAPWKGRLPFDFVHPDDQDRVATSFSGLHDHPGRRGPATYRIRRSDGDYVLVRVSGLNLLDDDQYRALVLEIRPIDDEQRAEALATDQYEVLEHILAGQPLDATLLEIAKLVERHGDRLQAALLMIDDGAFRVAAAPNLAAPLRRVLHGLAISPGLLTCNEAVARAESAVSADLSTDPWWRTTWPAVASEPLAACWSVAILDPSTQAALGTLDVFRPEPGEPRLEDWAVPVLGARLAGIAIDRAGWISELEHQSAHDSLTGLLNRRAFVRELDEMLTTLATATIPTASPDGDDAHAVALLFVDVDRFKVVNDTHGHEVGDVVLQEVATRLAAITEQATGGRGSVGRFGGDEFVVAWPACRESADAVHVAEQVRRAMEQPMTVGHVRVLPRSSIGIATAEREAAGTVTGDDLVRNADAALNQAKVDGRNRWVFYDHVLRLAHLERRATEADLERALTEDELRVFFQPVVSLSSHLLAGIEALVRWQHPERGLLPPAAFIDVAEDAGLVTTIDQQVLAAALPIVRRWNASRAARELAPLTLWVNFSARHLVQPDAVDRILGHLLDDDPAGSLGVELTESALLGDPIAAAGLLARLRGAGIGVAIDDFGTGYSSLAALRTLPATHLKIDRRFVNGLLHDLRDRAIVEATLQLAHAFGLGVTAEGVETRGQAEELGRLGCDLAQGYLYGRPVPAEDLEAVLGNGLDRPALSPLGA